jgi:hypothetical protein
MRRFRAFFLGLVLFITGCAASITPTPVLIHRLVNANDEVKQLYLACSNGPNYFPEKPGCTPQLLEEKTVSTMELAKEFIRADIKQPQGYDIYLSISMIYFRIGQRNSNDYTEAERIARQFFEVQKASSGRSLEDARFYWVVITTGHASWQWYNERPGLDADRKTDLLLCLSEGTIASQQMETSPRKVRLLENLVILKAITDAI